MRYTTRSYGETVRVVGRFTAGRLATQIQLSLVNLETGSIQAITTPNCVEIAGTSVGGRSLYVWPTSNITTQPTVKTEFIYVMQDTVTGQIQEGKIVLGGFPDQSAISRYESMVHIDPANGVPLTTPGVFEFPIGTPGTPVSNVTDARTIADFLGVRQYHVNGAITLTANHDNWTFAGEEPRQDIITVNPGVTTDDSSFSRIGIRGTLSGTISASECLIGPTVGGTIGVAGVFTDCGFQGVIELADGAVFRGLRINFLDLTGTIVDLSSPTTLTQFLALSAGNFSVRNANSNCIMGVSMQGGIVTHEASNVNAISYLFGIGERNDLGATWLLDVDNLVRGSRIDTATGTRASATDVQRLYSENTETVVFTANTAIPSGQNGRFVPAGAISHVRVRIKAEAASNWASPTDTFFVVFNYFPGAAATDRSASAATQAAAPVDGTFTSVTPP